MRPSTIAPVSAQDVRDAAALLDGVITRTPVLPSRALAQIAETDVLLKCENLQRAGSFKVRGAYTRLSRLTPAERGRGVVAASAGNHAQGVALAANMLGIDALVFMPLDAPLPKLSATRGYGAEVRQVGTSVDEALAAARVEAARSGRILIHPFDHKDIVAGQGTIALEILEQVPEVGTIVVPLGGGGLVAGIAAALADVAPHVRVVGVQAAQAAAYPGSLAAGRPTSATLGPTMADGIAVGTPGDVPYGIVVERGVEVRTVGEEMLSRGLLMVLERNKLLVEPAGAAAVAGLLAAEPGEFPGPVVPVLSGGNVDPLVLLRVVRHGLVSAGRYLQLRVRLLDRPGALASLVEVVASSGANIVHVAHSRMDMDLSVAQVRVDMQVETKSAEHRTAVVEHLRTEGYDVDIT